MCGIAGYYHKKGKQVQDTSTILRMLDLQKHRGPDDSGICSFSLLKGVCQELSNNSIQNVNESTEGVLGFNRLSILDLSINGHQPMFSQDGKVVLTLNGEIYNAFDFKDELQSDGFCFRSTSDTEVVLYLYLKYGFDGMINRLNGMFAIVLLDLRQSAIYIARDRFGIKPMYLYETDELFAFSSEIKSFLALPGFKAELDFDLMDEYLLFRNNIDDTLFKNIKGLTPGTYMKYSPGKGFETKSFFNIDQFSRHEVDRNGIDLSIKDISQTLNDSVKRQLISDVKLGCQLSGGIDSSLVTHFAKQVNNNGLLETISITLEDSRFSEEPYMDHVAKIVDVKAHKFQLDASYYLDSFEKAIWHFEGPLNHPNTIGIFLLSERARDYVTVLLSGEGADEVLGGYSRFASINNPYKIRTVLSGLKNNRNDILKYISNYREPASRAVLASAFMQPVMASMLMPSFNFDAATAKRLAIFANLSGSLFDRQIKYEINTYLPDLLIRQDKMSMAHSIENRVPFLDNQFVEKAFAIPECHLIPKNANHTQTKFVLKQLAAQLFGDQFSFRTKQGFGIPLRGFFKNPQFNSYLLDEIIPSIISRGIFNGRLVRKWAENLDDLSAKELDALWIMVSFEVWAKKFKVA